MKNTEFIVGHSRSKPWIDLLEPADEPNFIDKFTSPPPINSGATTPIEIEGFGQREVSTRALGWMAMYREHTGDPNFRERVCHDFAATFLNHDPEISRCFDKFGYLPIEKIPAQAVISPRIHLHFPLDAAILMASVDSYIGSNDLYSEMSHSAIAATQPNRQKPQLFISKFSLEKPFLHTLTAAALYYGVDHVARVRAEDYRRFRSK